MILDTNALSAIADGRSSPWVNFATRYACQDDGKTTNCGYRRVCGSVRFSTSPTRPRGIMPAFELDSGARALPYIRNDIWIAALARQHSLTVSAGGE